MGNDNDDIIIDTARRQNYNAAAAADAFGGSDNTADDEDEADLAAILATMDIDKDFNNWTSFRSSVVSYNKSTTSGRSASETSVMNEVGAALPPATPSPAVAGAADASSDSLGPDLARLRSKLARLEVFSRHYLPTPDEAKEVTDLAAFLGLTSSKSFLGALFGGGGGGKLSKKSLVPQDSSPVAAASPSPNTTASPILSDRERFESIQESSVLLFRSFALLETTGVGSGSSSLSSDAKDVEVILLTRGLVVADVKRRSSKRNVLMRTFLACVTWDLVDHVVERTGRNSGASWELHFKKSSSSARNAAEPSSKTSMWTFTAASTAEQGAWLDALETVLVRTHIHSRAAGSSSPRAGGRKTLDFPHRLGWQYMLVHRGGYTAAVTGVLDGLPVPVKSVNARDSYNGSTMLIYAVRSGSANVAAHLLENCRADVDAADRDGHTAMYYATRDRQHDMQQILLEHGAEPSMDAAQCGCGELFGAVSDAQEVIDYRRDREAAQARQAREVQNQMSDNLRLMQERGTKIRDMGDKATQLNEGAANYADMARQLKEKSQKPGFFGLL